MNRIISSMAALSSVLITTSSAWAYSSEVYAVSDIAQQGYASQAQATAALITGNFGRIVVMGDANNITGTYEEYLDYYAPYWGQHWSKTWPVPGNHDYMTANAEGFMEYMSFAYLNTYYYDYVEGDWYFIALDSICARTDGCKETQLAWLQEKLFVNRDYACTLAYYHEPRFSSGSHGSNDHMTDIWNTLYSGGVDVVLSGHDHVYERFKPMGINGDYESYGMYEFVVGTGGAQLRSFSSNIHPSSEKRIARKNGVLWLGLDSTSFDFEFRQTDGTVADSGSNITCYY